MVWGQDVQVFDGAKVILFVGSRLVVLRRDATPVIAWPGRLDLPGGGREAGETPFACVAREVHEEVGLSLTPRRVIAARRCRRPFGWVWIFVARLPSGAAQDLRLGHEGQACFLSAPAALARASDAVPHLARHVGEYLAATRLKR